MKFSAQPIAFLLSSAGLVGAANLRSPARGEVDFVDGRRNLYYWDDKQCGYNGWTHLNATQKECISAYEHRNRVFVTNKKIGIGADRPYTTDDVNGPAFNTVASAHARCQEAAVNADLEGTFKAWISDSSISPLHFLARTGRYFNTNKSHEDEIAPSFECLVDSLLTYPIQYDEEGNDLSGLSGNAYVWTGTNEEGKHGSRFNCKDWQDETAVGQVGLFTKTNFQWSKSGDRMECTTKQRLYCFEAQHEVELKISDPIGRVRLLQGSPLTYNDILIPPHISNKHKYSLSVNYAKPLETSGMCAWVDVKLNGMFAGRLHIEDEVQPRHYSAGLLDRALTD